jgi:hypothetical protein
MAHPVRRCAPQLAGERRVIGLDAVGGSMEEAAQDLSQPRRSNTAGRVEMTEQQRIR